MSTAKSVILSCAGIGSRLGLGKTKVLIDINGKPLIYYHLQLFKNVKDLRIVVGFQANEVIQEVLKYRKDVVFVYNHDYFGTKTGASFYLGAKDGNDYAIEYDGDLLVHPDDFNRIYDMDDEYICYADKSSDDSFFDVMFYFNVLKNNLNEITEIPKIIINTIYNLKIFRNKIAHQVPITLREFYRFVDDTQIILELLNICDKHFHSRVVMVIFYYEIYVRQKK